MPTCWCAKVENYSKGKNVIEELTKEKIPIPGLSQDFVWMHVNAGSKMRNLLDYALKSFKDKDEIVWSGSGAAVGKTISCAEIVKRRYKGVHQITKICFRKEEEHWDPLLEELDPLVVEREIPAIHILLSKKPLNTSEPGYQAPDNADAFWKVNDSEVRRRGAGPHRNKTSRIPPEEFAALGLRTGQRRPKNINEKGRHQTQQHQNSFERSKKNENFQKPADIEEKS